MFPGDDGQAYHRVLGDADQAARLPDPTTLLEVRQDRQSLVVGQLAAVQGGALTFREALLTGTTGQDAAVLVGAIAKAHPQIVEAAFAVVRARLVLTAEQFPVVPEASHHPEPVKKVILPLPSA